MIRKYKKQLGIIEIVTFKSKVSRGSQKDNFAFDSEL